MYTFKIGIPAEVHDTFVKITHYVIYYSHLHGQKSRITGVLKLLGFMKRIH